MFVNKFLRNLAKSINNYRISGSSLCQFNPLFISISNRQIYTSVELCSSKIRILADKNKMTSSIVHVYNDIIKPSGDNRLYRGLVLENGFKCLLISDSTTDRSAASVDVNIGSMLDPIPGLAHFCEHMLFLGSEKFPKENTFAKYIEDHAGNSNAYTGSENTNYYFDISNQNLNEALDIFSQFFIKPLFDNDSTDREINAVNSENNKNLQVDGWRLYQFEKSLCKSTHPYSKFSTGNLKTLKEEPLSRGINVRDELIKFHGKYYSSNLMSMCVLSHEPLDTMQQHVLDLFSNVPNKNLKKIEFESNPFDENKFGSIYYVVPIQDLHRLSVLFQVPDLRDYYESDPAHYLTHLIGHEGPGSLLSELKSRGWATSICAECGDGARGFEFFKISVSLSENGLTYINDILMLIFQYINLIKSSSIQKWIFDELSTISKIKFEYKDKEKPINYVARLSSDMHNYNMNDILRGAYCLTKYEPKLIENLLNLLRPDQMQVMVVSKNFTEKANKIEPWYNTQYYDEKMDENLLDKLKNCGLNEALKLPAKNEFIPEDFNLVKQELDGHDNRFPYVLKQTPLQRLWYRQDDKFLLPKASLCIDIRTPLSNLDPKHSNMASLFTELVTDSLNEYAYDADLAGLRYRLDKYNYGIQLSVNGFDNKLDILLDKIIDHMTELKIDENRYNVIKEQYQRDLQNFQTDQPYQHAVYFMTALVIEKGWTKEDLLNAIDEFSIEDMKNFVEKFWKSEIYVESLIFGNITEKRALKISDNIESKLSKFGKLRALDQSQLNNYRHVLLPNKCDLVYVKDNKIHKTVGIEVYYQCNDQSTRNNVLTELFCQIINESTYNVLRTQEQLGYIVASGIRRFSGMQGVRFILQSDRSPDILDEKIENYVSSIRDTLKNMTNEEFQCHVHALELTKLKEPKKISEQCNIYWDEINTREYHFDRENIEVAELKNLTKDDIIEFYENLINPNSASRKKLAVYINPLEDCETVKNKVNHKLIKNIKEFKNGLELCELPKPYPYNNYSI